MTVVRNEHKGSARSAVLTTALGNSTADRTIYCDDLTGWPTGASSRPFYATIDRGTATEERILCSARAANVLTVFDDGVTNGRAVDDTTIANHAINATIEHTGTAKETDDANAHILETTTAHGLTLADVITTTNTKTLTNKTISQAQIVGLVADLAAKVPASIADAKGDIIAATAADTVARVAVGTDGKVLKADSAAAAGVSWGVAGKILQVAVGTKVDTSTFSSATYTDLTGLTATITPTSASSTILCMVMIGMVDTSAADFINFKIVRASTDLTTGTAAGSRTVSAASYGAQGGGGNNGKALSMQAVDSPASTSALTYKVQIQTGIAAITAYINRSVTDGDAVGYPRAASTMILMEIGA